MPAIPEFHPLPERSPLNRERIVASALSLAKEHGLPAVSMRRLARELGVQPMSLYYHIPSRAVLMVLMAERSIASVPGAEATTPWDDRLVGLMLGVYRVGVEDPAVFPVLASEVLGTRMLGSMPSAAGPASLSLVDRMAELLAEAGVAASGHPGTCRALIGLVVGFLVGQVDGLVPTGGAAAPGSDRRDDPDETPLAGGDVRQPDPEMRAMHAADPATDLVSALRIFVRGLVPATTR